MSVPITSTDQVTSVRDQPIRDQPIRDQPIRDLPIRDQPVVCSTIPFDDQVQQEHLEFARVYDLYKKSFGLEKQQWANQLIKLVSVCLSAEEMVIYPMEEKKIAKQVVARFRDEHLQVKKVLYELDQMKVTDADYDLKMDHAWDLIKGHGREAETDYLPLLKSKLTPEEINNLSCEFRDAKTKAPTHPHPDMPDRGGLSQKLADIAVFPIDKFKDASRDFPPEQLTVDKQK